MATDCVLALAAGASVENASRWRAPTVPVQFAGAVLQERTRVIRMLLLG